MCSFSADTLVSTTSGLVAIVDIEVGDKVYAYHEANESVGTFDVAATISHIDTEITFVTIHGETIETTPWHDFYTDEGWEDAGDLQIGDLILSLDGNYYVVDSVETVPGEQVMYDLTVDDAHTFAVGTGRWVVHNICVTTPSGQVVDIPNSYSQQSRTRRNNGTTYQNPNATHREGDMIRIMDPGADPRYPNGYMIYTNSSGQPIDPLRGVAGNSRTQTHISLPYTGPLLGWPK